MKDRHEEGMAIHSAPSFALHVAGQAAQRKQVSRWAGYRAPKTCHQDADALTSAEANMTRSFGAPMRQEMFDNAGSRLHVDWGVCCSYSLLEGPTSQSRSHCRGILTIVQSLLETEIAFPSYNGALTCGIHFLPCLRACLGTTRARGTSAAN